MPPRNLGPVTKLPEFLSSATNLWSSGKLLKRSSPDMLRNCAKVVVNSVWNAYMWILQGLQFPKNVSAYSKLWRLDLYELVWSCKFFESVHLASHYLHMGSHASHTYTTVWDYTTNFVTSICWIACAQRSSLPERTWIQWIRLAPGPFPLRDQLKK